MMSADPIATALANGLAPKSTQEKLISSTVASALICK